MTPATDLARLDRWARKRLVQLKMLARPLAAGNVVDPALSFIVIEIDNLLYNLFQNYAVSCLSCHARSTSSGRVTTSVPFASAQHAMAFALSLINIPRYNYLKKPASVVLSDWPRSRNPKDWELVLSRAGCSILPSFQTAISLNASVFSRIGTLRNFYAHRNYDTSAKVIRMAARQGQLTVGHPDDYCLAMAGGPAPNVVRWLSEIEVFASLMVR